MKEIVLAVFSFVEWYRWETCSFPFQFYPCNMASMVYNSWTKIKKPKLYSLYHMDHIIWSFMDYEKCHITWAILYAPILYRFCLQANNDTTDAHHNRKHWYNLIRNHYKLWDMKTTHGTTNRGPLSLEKVQNKNFHFEICRSFSFSGPFYFHHWFVWEITFHNMNTKLNYHYLYRFPCR